MRSQTDNPQVLVGISTHNRADILPKAIDSALRQSYPALRVHVLDDASSDGTALVAIDFPRVQWTHWKENRGYVAARNHMMLGSTASYYVSLDDDAWFLDTDEIGIAVQVLEAHPDIAAVAFDILSPDRPAPSGRSVFIPASMFIGCGHVLRLDVVRKLKGYEAFPGSYGGEEKDFSLRLMDVGYRVVKCPGVHVWHDKTPVARDFPAQHRSAVCNDLTIAMMRTPLAALPATLAWKVLRNLLFAVRARTMRPCLSGMSAFLRSIPAIWRGRKPVKLGTLWSFRKQS